LAVMITTIDNPYDPRTNFPAWYTWDVSEGYHTCAYLARVLVETDDFPQEYNDRLVEQAIDEIIELHAGGVYKKVELS
jgi:hypothetical protein